MRYFVDTEFYESGPGHPIQPISLAIVAEDGREFYAEVPREPWWFHGPQLTWIREHVWPYLRHANGDRSALVSVGATPAAILAFIGHDPSPEFWGYYCDYDWVMICQLFGTMSALPSGWPCYCRDLRQSLDERGLQAITQPDDAEHNALSDARWIAQTWQATVQSSPRVPAAAPRPPDERIE